MGDLTEIPTDEGKLQLAFLDDHSRLAVGYRFGYAEDTVRLAAALRTGVGRPGCPSLGVCR